MMKHGLEDATTLNLESEPAGKKARYTPDSTALKPSNLTPSSSATSPLGSSRKTPIELFDLDSDDSDSDVIDLTTACEISPPKPKQAVRPTIKPETSGTLERLTSPQTKTEFDTKIADLQFGAPISSLSRASPKWTSPASNTPATPTFSTHDPASNAFGPPVGSKFEFGASYLNTQELGLPPLSHQAPKLELSSNLPWSLKTDDKHGTAKKELNGASLYYYPVHPSSSDNSFNPILGEVGPFPNAPRPNANDDEIHSFLVGHTNGDSSLLPPNENDKAIQEIIESLPVDEHRLAGMPKAKQPVELRSRLLDHQLQVGNFGTT